LTSAMHTHVFLSNRLLSEDSISTYKTMKNSLHRSFILFINFSTHVKLGTYCSNKVYKVNIHSTFTVFKT